MKNKEITSEINYNKHIFSNCGQNVVIADYGPMQLRITAYKDGGFLEDLSKSAARIAINHLLWLIDYQSTAKKRWNTIDMNAISVPIILKKMWQEVFKTKESTLTPMAAVKGVIADLTADWLVEKGAGKVLVDNGGDIALRCPHGEKFRVGISAGVNNPGIAGYLDIDGSQGIRGVATSGLGGKGFTTGIADAVVVFAESAGIADACATIIGNYTSVKHPLVTSRPARFLDPNTDIPGILVTSWVDKLPGEFIQEALHQGAAKGKELIKNKKIIGALIFCQGHKISVPENLYDKLNSAESKKKIEEF